MEINGLEYSRNQFEDYKIRCKVELIKDREKYILDIYTTDTNKESVENVLLDRRQDGVTSLTIFHWATKEEDDATSKFLDEILKD